ncbi:hypothetical protein [Ekhidna sp.]|uniref:hypothetical protein n=1 Tax=Ekhidna sp. TaxID=2608089 RepID=UPI003298B4F1
MLKSLVYILVLILSFSVSSQYSQNIDTLSRREIKELILKIDGKHPSKTYLKKHDAHIAIGAIFFVAGAILLTESANRPDPANDSEVDFSGMLQFLTGLLASACGFGIFASSHAQYLKAIESYRGYSGHEGKTPIINEPIDESFYR